MFVCSALSLAKLVFSNVLVGSLPKYCSYIYTYTIPQLYKDSLARQFIDARLNAASFSLLCLSLLRLSFGFIFQLALATLQSQPQTAASALKSIGNA